MTRKTYLIGAAVAAAMLPMFALTAMAASPDAGARGFRGGFGMGMMHGRPPGVFGSVTAISGSTITVSSKGFGQGATATTYTVDASAAKIDKNGAAAAITDMTVGDKIRIDGAISGTAVTATAIHDGMGRPGMNGRGEGGQLPPQIAGDGQPVIMGTVSTISGTALTISNNGSAAYSVDASSAKITKAGKPAAASDISVGDKVLVQGAVNGTSVAATTVMDQAAAHPAIGAAAGSNDFPQGPRAGGFFGRIYGFFSHLFGF